MLQCDHVVYWIIEIVPYQLVNGTPSQPTQILSWDPLISLWCKNCRVNGWNNTDLPGPWPSPQLAFILIVSFHTIWLLNILHKNVSCTHPNIYWHNLPVYYACRLSVWFNLSLTLSIDSKLVNYLRSLSDFQQMSQEASPLWEVERQRNKDRIAVFMFWIALHMLIAICSVSKFRLSESLHINSQFAS